MARPRGWYRRLEEIRSAIESGPDHYVREDIEALFHVSRAQASRIMAQAGASVRDAGLVVKAPKLLAWVKSLEGEAEQEAGRGARYREAIDALAPYEGARAVPIPLTGPELESAQLTTLPITFDPARVTPDERRPGTMTITGFYTFEELAAILYQFAALTADPSVTAQLECLIDPTIVPQPGMLAPAGSHAAILG